MKSMTYTLRNGCPLVTPFSLMKYKTSDTLVILGAGASLNDLSEKNWVEIEGYDTAGTTSTSLLQRKQTYYFLETTTEGKLCGFIPNEYRELTSEVYIHPVSDRPLLDHSWQDGTITIFTSTERGDFVKVKLFVENIGISTAENIIVEASFFMLSKVCLSISLTRRPNSFSSYLRI